MEVEVDGSINMIYSFVKQTYATLGRPPGNVPRISPISPTQSVVTRANFKDHRIGPEIVTTSNRIQESCI